jgi:hypothetical protein
LGDAIGQWVEIVSAVTLVDFEFFVGGYIFQPSRVFNNEKATNALVLTTVCLNNILIPSHQTDELLCVGFLMEVPMTSGSHPACQQ